ncbi:S8 family serine peptidase [Chthonobacter albigriseus]|uniref:S8 family serine peptidase n=1 Tax=Chthonobacter albigriseus TaxID=1683161 RepID=UPI0015EFBFC9|nr:S8 family serine peptidase [Chthonobacter albigriseus]
MATRALPTDPMIATSWHFKALSIDRVWNEYSGAGTSTGVYDDGIQITHEDLAANYDASKELVIGGVRYSGAMGDAQHGTAVAGIIGAVADNGKGGAGISYGTKLTGVTILGDGPDFMTAIRSMNRFDTTNNSWNWVDKFVDSPTSWWGSEFLAGLKSAVDTGRGGLGTVIVNAAGNDWTYDRRDANTSEFNATRFTITVAATSSNGDVSSYSNRGASILVAGAGDGIATTDRMGTSGYGSGNYITGFAGTSAATPTVTGIVNLMHEASGNKLGWRDVQDIIAITADQTTATSLSATGVAGQGAFTWTINKANGVDGGGMHFSNDVGFGRIDAYEAVRLAEVWTRFGAAKTSANELKAVASGSSSIQLTDNASASFSFAIGTQLLVEHVDLTLTLTHGNLNDLQVELFSAEGTRSIVLTPGTGVQISESNFTWAFGSEAFRGELSAGTWTVKITDTRAGSTGSLSGWKLEAFGSAVSQDSVYHYTDEFLKLKALDASRGVLADTGGIDWINLAAVGGQVVADLLGPIVVAGSKWIDIAAGTLIENIVSSDGNDILKGNGAANKLVGMRGDDTLAGLGGADVLDGGVGTDTADYSASAAAVQVDLAALFQIGGDAQGDSLVSIENVIGSALGDTLSGDAGNNVLAGGGGNDSIDGRVGIDTVVFANVLSNYAIAKSIVNGVTFYTLTDKTGATGVDTVSNVEIFRFASGDLTVAQVDALAVNGVVVNSISGTTAADTLNGTVGADQMKGLAGNDLIRGSAGADSIDGGDGIDTVDYSLSTAAVQVHMTNPVQTGGFAAGDVLTNVENLTGSAYGDELRGNADANTILGGNGNDVLEGRAGADRLDGGAGIDIATYWSSSSGVNVDLARASQLNGDAQGDVLIAIENINGSNFADFIAGNGAANTLNGFAGNDTFIGRAGADTIDGGDGIDAVSYAGSLGVNIDLTRASQLLNDAAGDVLRNIENVTGSSYADTLAGNAGNNVLTGSGGADFFRFVGDFGNDTISDFVRGTDKIVVVGRAYSNLLFSVSGADKLIAVAGTDDTIRLAGGASLALTSSDFRFA